MSQNENLDPNVTPEQSNSNEVKANTASYDYHNDPSLSEKWKTRFDFYDKYGPLSLSWSGNKVQNEKLKELPFGQRFLIMFNLWAFFFGFFYLLYLGLWKKALIVLGASVVITIITAILHIPGIGNLIIAIGMSMLTNGWYYQYKVKGKHDWSL